MSRSRKKFPFWKDVNSSKWGKRICNKRIRRMSVDEEIPNGNAYRKLNERWDYIYDYCGSESWKEYKIWIETPRPWREAEEANYYEWYRAYIGK